MSENQSPVCPVRLPEDLRAEAEKHARKRKLTLGALIRLALAKEIGRPELAGRGRGRPRKES